MSEVDSIRERMRERGRRGARSLAGFVRDVPETTPEEQAAARERGRQVALKILGKAT
jgi:hypothetical protein